MRELLCILILSTLLGVSGCKSRPTETTESKARWTLLFYTDADNDLEESSMNDLRQLLKVGSSQQVQLVMLCDRSVLDSNEDGYSNERIFNLEDWNTAHLMHLGVEEVHLLDDWGEVNMADPETLRRFVTVAQERFPADNYALFVGDHGSGWEGVCSDDSAEEDDLLTLNELSTALEETNPLTLIGLDACSMATLETALILSPHAQIMVASEELEPLLGWDYATMVHLLKEQPHLTGTELAKVILTSYQRSFDHNSNAEVRAEGLGITLSAIDLRKMEPVKEALAALSITIRKHLEAGERKYWLSLASSRAESDEYDEAFDLVGFCKALSKNAPDAETQKVAKNLQQAVEEAVIGKVHGPARADSHGLSVYFPADLDSLPEYRDLELWKQAPWPETLTLFLEQMRGSAQPLLSDLKVSSEIVLPHKPVTLRARLEKPEEVAHLYLILASREENDLTILGRREISSTKILSQDWNGAWLASDEGTVFPLWSEDLTRVPAKVDDQDVVLQMHGQKLIMATRSENGRQRQQHLQPGTTLTPLYPVVDALGEHTLAQWGEASFEIEKTDQLVLSVQEVETGGYEVGFLAVDFEDNWDLKVKPVRFGLGE
jgi:clostripain